MKQHRKQIFSMPFIREHVFFFILNIDQPKNK